MEIEKDKQNETRWEMERKMFFRKNGMAGREIKKMKEKGINIISRLVERDIEIQRQMQFNRIQDMKKDIKNYA